MKLRPIHFLWILLIFFFSTCVVFPLFCVGLTPSAEDFKNVFTSAVWRGAMLNTVIECVCSTVLSVAVGYIFAYAVVRGDVPFPRIFGMIPIIHLVTPPFVGGLSFILLLGRQGFITHKILGLNISLYGFWGLLIAQVLCFFPIAYLMCSQTLKAINPNLEQAARGMGATSSKVFFSVTLPLSLPGIVSSLLFISVSVLSDFGNPMIVAGRFRVLAVEIYTQLTGWLNAGTSSVLGLLLVVPSVILFFFQNKLMQKQNQKIAVIGGKGFTMKRKKTSLPVKIFLTVFCSFISLCVIAQFLAIIAGSFQKLWGINTAFTLNHIKEIGRFSKELLNSVVFALISAILSTIIACVSAFIVNRTPLRAKHFMDISSQIAAAVPGSLFGLAFSLAANRIGFHSSRTMIIIAMTVGFLPFSYRIMTSTFSQIKSTLDDGAVSLGAGKIRILTTILLPLSSGGAFNAFLYDFVRGVGTMSAVIFLVSFDTPLASIKILNLAEQGDWGKAAALSLVLTFITFAVLGISRLFFRRKQ